MDSGLGLSTSFTPYISILYHEQRGCLSTGKAPILALHRKCLSFGDVWTFHILPFQLNSELIEVSSFCFNKEYPVFVENSSDASSNQANRSGGLSMLGWSWRMTFRIAGKFHSLLDSRRRSLLTFRSLFCIVGGPNGIRGLYGDNDGSV